MAPDLYTEVRVQKKGRNLHLEKHGNWKLAHTLYHIEISLYNVTIIKGSFCFVTENSKLPLLYT